MKNMLCMSLVLLSGFVGIFLDKFLALDSPPTYWLLGVIGTTASIVAMAYFNLKK